MAPHASSNETTGRRRGRLAGVWLQNDCAIMQLKHFCDAVECSCCVTAVTEYGTAAGGAACCRLTQPVSNVSEWATGHGDDHRPPAADAAAREGHIGARLQNCPLGPCIAQSEIGRARPMVMSKHGTVFCMQERQSELRMPEREPVAPVKFSASDLVLHIAGEEAIIPVCL